MSNGERLMVAAVGNTRSRVGVFEGQDLRDPESVPSSPGMSDADHAALVVERMLAIDSGGDGRGVIALAGVHPGKLERVEGALSDAGCAARVVVLGRDVPYGLNHRLDDASTLGHDRILCAMAAYHTARGACAVIDAGTAVTIDFVDGEGVFCGGHIVPGIRAMLASLHDSTAQLPEVGFDPSALERGVFGLDTAHAMQLGVVAAVTGAVRVAVERFAEAYDGYPRVIATGGDAPLITEEGFIEHVVPDLQLTGMRLTVTQAAENHD